MGLLTAPLTCPACRDERDHVRWQGYPVSVATRTDFHERYIGPSRLLHECLLCTNCGFAARDLEWTSGDGLAEYLAAHIQQQFKPSHLLLPNGISEKFERAAQVAEIMERPARYIGDLWLKAAWGCVEEDDIEAERYYRRKAVWALESAMLSYDGVEPGEKAMVAYLCGELWRRIGDRIQAHEWFVVVKDHIIDEATRYLEAAALQQDEAPLEWFARKS